MNLNPMRFDLTLLSLILFCLTLPALAQEPKDFDKNHDGKLDITEIRAFLMHRFSPAFKVIDTAKDGVISESERDEFTNDFLDDIRANLGNKAFYDIQEIRDLYPPKSKFDFFGIRIRDSYEEVTFDVEEKSFQKAKPALGSFARDIASNENVWSAKGTVMRPIRLYSPGNDLDRSEFYLSAFAIVPSISFNRVISSKKSQEANSLQTRLGFNFEFAGGLLELQSLRLFGTYATDFDFESKVIATQFQWEPIPTGIAIGVYKPILPNVLRFRWRFFTHFEYGYVVDAGAKTNIKEKDQFFRLGPKLEIDLNPVSVERLETTIKWEYLYGPIGIPKDSRLWNLTVTYQIDEVGHYNIQIEYSKGQIPLTEEDVENLTFGIGIKF